MFGRKTRRQRERDTDPRRFKARSRTELTRAIAESGPATSKQGKSKSGKAAGKVPKVADLPPDSPWRIDASHFPWTGGPSDQLRFCLRYAVLAPSSHNTQPWRFRVESGVAMIFADRTRALPVTDPDDRELVISVGCALHHLLVASARFGLKVEVKQWPDRAQPDLAATVGVLGQEQPSERAESLALAMLGRRTVRHAFDDQPVPPQVVRTLVDAASEQGATLHVVTDAEERFRLAKLVGEADLVQFSNRGFRRELSLWMHHNRTHAADGIPGFALGMSEFESLAAPLVVRTFDMGKGRAAKDEELALHSPVLAVLGTPADGPGQWLDAGRALSAVLLEAVRHGLAASYLNQPVEIAETRLRLKALATEVGWPQIVLRLGYCRLATEPHTPRRPLADVLDKPGPRPKPAKQPRP